MRFRRSWYGMPRHITGQEGTGRHLVETRLHSNVPPYFRKSTMLELKDMK